MADTVRWYIDGVISRIKSEVGGVHRLTEDFEPQEVFLKCRLAGKGDKGTEVDILSDGVSIFSDRPTLNTNDTEKVWTTMPANKLEKGSILRMDITQICDEHPCRDLTVELH